MMDLMWILLGLLTAIAVNIWFTPRIWRGDYKTIQSLSRQYATWLPISEAVAMDLVRAHPAIAVGVLLGFVSAAWFKLTLILHIEPAVPVMIGIVAVGLVGLFLVVFVQGTIVVFNRPKSLVPPKLRSEQGLAARLRAGKGRA